MSHVTHREYYAACQRLSTAALRRIIETPTTNARLTSFDRATIRLVLRQRQQRIEESIFKNTADPSTTPLS